MILTLFEKVQTAYTRQDQIVDASWPQVAEFLMTKQEAKAKEEVWLFNLWQFNPQGEPGRKYIYEKGEKTQNYEEIPNTIRRCKANATGCWGLVLDFDENKTIGDTIAEMEGIEFVLYSTFRNTPEKNKFRVVLPFSRPLSPSETRLKKESFSQTFQEVDHASFSESQSFYLHSGPVAFTHWNKGIMLDPDWFEDEVIEEAPKLERGEFTGDRANYKELLAESLATCKGLHYNGPTKYNVLTLVALCKSADFSFEEYNAICWHMSAPDSSLQKAELRKAAWQGWNPHSGITAKVREEFIKSHGGVSRFGKFTNPTIEKIKAKYRVTEE